MHACIHTQTLHIHIPRFTHTHTCSSLYVWAHWHGMYTYMYIYTHIFTSSQIYLVGTVISSLLKLTVTVCESLDGVLRLVHLIGMRAWIRICTEYFVSFVFAHVLLVFWDSVSCLSYKCKQIHVGLFRCVCVCEVSYGGVNSVWVDAWIKNCLP